MSTGGYVTHKINLPLAKIAVVAASWHERIMQGLIDGAMREIARAEATATLFRVPGSFELPLACQKLLHNFDAAVALGVVIRGDTPHFEYVAMAATQGLSQVSLATGKPIGFGVLTVENEQQGIERAGLATSQEDKGAEAAGAALAMVSLSCPDIKS